MFLEEFEYSYFAQIFILEYQNEAQDTNECNF